MKKTVAGLMVVASVLLICLVNWKAHPKNIFNDVSRLNPVQVAKIVQVKSVEDIQQAMQEARSKGLKVSIAGKRHSQGKQQSCPNCLVLDMLDFNKVLFL